MQLLRGKRRARQDRNVISLLPKKNEHGAYQKRQGDKESWGVR
jgi:hypothetical protein